MKKIKNIANTITVIRIISALSMLLFKPFSAIFLCLYLVCGISDMVDGLIARRTGTVSRAGMILDSIADLIFLAIAFFCFYNSIAFPIWIWWWVGWIAVIRLTSYGVGLAKFHSFAALHTYANKAAGLSLFLFPFIYEISDITKTCILLCSISSLSAIEEMVITIKANELNRDIKCLFSLRTPGK